MSLRSRVTRKGYVLLRGKGDGRRDVVRREGEREKRREVVGWRRNKIGVREREGRKDKVDAAH